MTQYQNLFNTYRVPRVNCDVLECHLSRNRPEEPSRTVLVIHNNQVRPKSAESLEAIKEAAFVLCLDKKPSVDEESDELTGVRQVFLGGTHGENGANRWFDKAVQLIVGENGHSGILFEHTPIDGGAMLDLADHCCDYIEKNGAIESSEIVEDMPRKLEFDLSADDLNDIRAAKYWLSRIRNDAELTIFHFPSYGKDLIKSRHMSPDSFLQMAMQLAFHK
ncbi:carnitine acyltransferase, putative [Ixodes scapularis]|uniref:Carnitine acyltransferase, putative n=1 Tax=Ixodes scapularis TaxID=6945 RepID=B7PN81_IXOSC|nr:carnitine acyltransferase, putative [Ixodes scapularis]|eukprot:XP_002435229.1 carnitine acyltransferase, putative [Ixodes scapularis]